MVTWEYLVETFEENGHVLVMQQKHLPIWQQHTNPDSLEGTKGEIGGLTLTGRGEVAGPGAFADGDGGAALGP